MEKEKMTISKPTSLKPTRKTKASLREAIKIFGGRNKDLAKKIGVSETMVSRWCLEKKPMSLRCARLIEKKSKGTIKISDLIPGLK